MRRLPVLDKESVLCVQLVDVELRPERGELLLEVRDVLGVAHADEAVLVVERVEALDDDVLLVVEVKGRASRHRDRDGLDAFHGRKRRRLACAIDCWRAEHAEFHGNLLRVVLALVPLIQGNRNVIWLDVERLC